jgi:hypothetical protein
MSTSSLYTKIVELRSKCRFTATFKLYDLQQMMFKVQQM